jgi:hypothetical protein
MAVIFFSAKNDVAFGQGSLAKGEGPVQLTSLQ